MNSVAQAFWLGLQRSSGFITFFTRGMEGEDWYHQPPGAPNPPIWILGHLAYSRAQVLELLTGKSVYEEGWADRLAIGVEPQDATTYPDVDSCLRVLDARLKDLRSFLDSVSEEELSSPPSIPSRFFTTKMDVLIHLSHHEAHHTGSLSLLRRMRGHERLI